MPWTRRRFLAVTGAAALVPLALSGRAWARARADRFFTWERLRDGVWAAVGDGGNSLVVRAGDGLLLVDTKYPGIARALRREAESHGGTVAKVVNTHHHADHTGGNVAFTSDVPVLAHNAAGARVAAQIDRFRQLARSGPAQLGRDRGDQERVAGEAAELAEMADGLAPEQFVPTSPINRFPHEERVGSVAVELHHFGAGHTDNDVVVRVPSLDVLHAGDLLFNNLHPFFDPTGGVTCRGWIESVKRTVALCDERTMVVPGHGALTDAGGLRRQAEYLERLWDEVSKAVREGRERAEVEAMRWEFMDGYGYEQVRARAIGAVYEEVRAAGG
ncbi:MAG TPA: MBL fold metallo-hydrolase [Phycisphaerales bacterium]|nr:MBL fold metallo-hydrolase [Phycisphaerales bacterium]